MPTITIRELHDHVANPANDTLRIFSPNNPGAGGAHHRYEIYGFDKNKNPSHWPVLIPPEPPTTILFQNGPINEVGINGLTQEVLLAIVADRLRSFQAGPYACEENADALKYVTMALESLKERTIARMKRNVEGTNQV